MCGAETAKVSGATAGWPDVEDCVEGTADGSLGTAVTTEDCNCLRNATAASARGVSREIWPNEEGDG